LLTEEFVEVLKDIHALKCIRDSPDFALEDTIMIVNLDNPHGSNGSISMTITVISIEQGSIVTSLIEKSAD
jgi:hypothetical protein